MKYEKSCGAVIFDNLNNVLLIKNKKSNHWSFPKGHIEIGEDEVSCAIREVKEETNVDCLINEQNVERIFYMPKPFVKKEVVYFEAKYLTGEIIKQETEISDILWLNIKDAYGLITYNAEKQVLVNILDKMKNN